MPMKIPGLLMTSNLNMADLLWTVANGDQLCDHLALKYLGPQRCENSGRASPLITKGLVFLRGGGNKVVVARPPSCGGRMSRAYDKQ